MKRIHYLLLGLLVSLTIAAVSPGLPPTRIAPGANTTVVTNGINSFTIASAGGGSGVQLTGTNVFTGTNTFSQPVFITNRLVQAGVAWRVATLPDTNALTGVCYGNGLFVVVGSAGTGNRVKTSSDGVIWKSQTSAADNSWNAVCYGGGLFVAVAASGTGNRVMTSPDGATWTVQTSASDSQWFSVVYGNGTFVAVGNSGAVMSSPDGFTWTSRTAAEANAWFGVTYANGLFVAVSYTGANRVMTSPDGTTWTSRSAASADEWINVTYGNGRFVAVAEVGGSMSSADGITWTSGTSFNSRCVAYGGGLFVARSSTGPLGFYSLDGSTWITMITATRGVSAAYGNGVWVGVSDFGEADSSGTPLVHSEEPSNLLQGGSVVNGGVTISTGALFVGSSQVVTNQQGAVADASGGVVIDAEARTALNSLLAKLRTHGLISP